MYFSKINFQTFGNALQRQKSKKHETEISFSMGQRKELLLSFFKLNVILRWLPKCEAMLNRAFSIETWLTPEERCQRLSDAFEACLILKFSTSEDGNLMTSHGSLNDVLSALTREITPFSRSPETARQMSRQLGTLSLDEVLGLRVAASGGLGKLWQQCCSPPAENWAESAGAVASLITSKIGPSDRELRQPGSLISRKCQEKEVRHSKLLQVVVYSKRRVISGKKF